MVDFDIGLRNAHFAPLLGDGIFTQSALAWKHSRDVMRPFFASNTRANFEKIQSTVESVCDKMPLDGLVDLQPLLFDLTLESAVFFLFGDEVSSLDSTQSQI